MLWRTKPKLTTLKSMGSAPQQQLPFDVKRRKNHIAWGKGETGRFGKFFPFPRTPPAPAGSGAAATPLLSCALPLLAPPRPADTERRGRTRTPCPGPHTLSERPGSSSREGEHPQRSPRWDAAGAASATAKGGGGWEPWGCTPCSQAF